MSDQANTIPPVDAHTDINTPETSDSGNIHGMPVAFLTGLAKEERKDIFGWLQEDQLIDTSKIVYIGLRDVDAGEKKILREHNIKAYSMHDIDRYATPVTCRLDAHPTYPISFPPPIPLTPPLFSHSD